ncbi:MAG: hypothetical protein ACK55Z_16740 [bacterium]
MRQQCSYWSTSAATSNDETTANQRSKRESSAPIGPPLPTSVTTKQQQIGDQSEKAVLLLVHLCCRHQ